MTYNLVLGPASLLVWVIIHFDDSGSELLLSIGLINLTSSKAEPLQSSYILPQLQTRIVRTRERRIGHIGGRFLLLRKNNLGRPLGKNPGHLLEILVILAVVLAQPELIARQAFRRRSVGTSGQRLIHDLDVLVSAAQLGRGSSIEPFHLELSPGLLELGKTPRNATQAI